MVLFRVLEQVLFRLFGSVQVVGSFLFGSVQVVGSSFFLSFFYAFWFCSGCWIKILLGFLVLFRLLVQGFVFRLFGSVQVVGSRFFRLLGSVHFQGAAKAKFFLQGHAKGCRKKTPPE